MNAGPLHIVLVEPLIPQNTGTIARLTAATRTRLHLIEPLGFELSDRYLKRAGLDYWSEVDLNVYKNWEVFLGETNLPRTALWFFTKFAAQSYHRAAFSAGDALVFGNEEVGLRDIFHKTYPDRLLKIPMDNPKVRSLNLSNAASIALYEARRQLGLL
jgi:tRNA (cytidine/uridine-2'-O-)-methyltransferase